MNYSSHSLLLVAKPEQINGNFQNDHQAINGMVMQWSHLSLDICALKGRFSPARVHVVLADTSSEKALAAVTAGGSVVFARGPVPADGAQRARPQVVNCVHVCTLSRRGV